jgi:hypothetical protein
MKHRFIDFSKFVFEDVPKEDIEFSGPIDYLKYYLSDFVQVAFFAAQDAENEFAWPFDTLNYHFIDFTKVVFKTFRKQAMNSQCQFTTYVIT